MDDLVNTVVLFGLIILAFLGTLFIGDRLIGVNILYSKWECTTTEIINGKAECVVYTRKKGV